MAAVGGDIKEVTYNHPRLGSAVLYPKSKEDSTFDTGGYRVDDDANGVDGGGNMIKVMNAVRWEVEVVISHDMNNRQEADKIKNLAADPEDSEWTFAHVNGTVYGGKGSPVGDIKFNTQAATMSFKVAGGGELKRIP
jgi:hypothetical protein